MEKWKTIVDFDNYEVSSTGNVRRKACTITHSNGMLATYKEKYLKQETCRAMYKRVTFSYENIQKRHLVHRLVAIYFIPNPENKPCVNHIDGNGSNNDISNLEWCTYSENEKHSYDVLKKINPIRKLSNEAVLDIRKNCVKGVDGNTMLFTKKYNVGRGTILDVLNKSTYVEIT